MLKCIGENKIRTICGDVFEKRMCLRIVDKVRNSSIRESCGCDLSVLEGIERNVLKWFEHV